MKLSRINFIAFLSLINFLASSQVNISGGYVSGYWDGALSPYIINGDIEVHNDSLLVIGPGVDVILNGNYKITVRGRLMAFGTEEDSIRFIPADSIPTWNGMRFYNISGDDKDTCQLQYCRFEKVTSPSAGAILADHSDKIVIDHCLIKQNYNANGEGGGIKVNIGYALITNCMIRDNEAYGGGGILIESGNAIINGCEILNNHAWRTGGIELHGSSAIIENTVIRGNSSHIMGGGITTGYGTGPTCKNVIIENNTSGVGGGIMTAYSSFWLENSTIRENWGDYAGGIMIGTASSAYFSDTSRSNVYMNHSYRVQDISVGTSARLNVYLDTFTVFQPDSYLANPISSLNFNILHAKVTGQTGNDLYVSPEGSDDNSGLSLEEPLKTLEYAVRKIISSAGNPPTIYLDDGIYSDSHTGEYFPIGLKSNINLVSLNSLQAVIDSEGKNRGLLIFGRNGIHISKLKLINGYTSAGGGIYASGSNIKIDSCLFYRNYGTSGGGINLADGSNIIVTNCDFINNTAGSGAGCVVSSASSVVQNCWFENNVSSGFGGGVYITGDPSNIVNCLFLENRAATGGAVYTEWYDSKLINNTFHDNYAINGPTIYCISSNCQLINSIIWDDSVQSSSKIYLTSHYGAGYFMFTIDHCDLMNDTTCISAGDFILLNLEDGIISSDPYFFDPVNHDFELQDNSPCKDSGTPNASPYNLPITDLAGNMRIINDTVDMGCYENQLGVRVSNIDITPGFLVYPNPNDGHFYIRFSNKKSYLSVYDPMGKIIISNNLMDRNPYEVRLNDINTGLYFLQIKSADNIRSSKIIVRKSQE
jgi:hypothetical protein